MKTSCCCRVRHLLWLGFSILAGGIFFAMPVARAGLTLEMNVIRYHQYGYYFSPYLNTNNVSPSVPFGDYYITSFGYPTNGSSALYHFDTNGFNQSGGGSWGYGDFDGMIHELTNGNWSIFVTNSVTTNTYHFTVTANLSSNALPYVSITFPTDGAVNVTNQPTFTWQGPTNYGDLAVYTYNSSSYLPVTQTSWLSPQVLYKGINSFTAHYDSNSTTAVVSSVPMDNASNPISSWISTAKLQDYSTSQFTVGTVDPSGTSHTLVARYTWDTTNGDGTASGADSSGNGYNMNFGGGFGSQGGANSTNAAVAGPLAIQFHNGDGNSAGYVGWNPMPANLLAALAGSFSVSCWIKTTQNNFGWDQAPAYYGAGIVAADNADLANDVIPVALTGSKIGFNTGGDTEDVTLNSSAAVNDGVYHHVVVTRNQLTGQKIIYIDGGLDSFSSGTTNRLDAPQLLTIGALADARNSDASGTYYYNGFDGEVDDVQIYTGVLSSNEVAQLYATPGIAANQVISVPLVARYNFEATNAPGTDSSGNGNDANCGSGTGSSTNNDSFSTNAAVGVYARDYFGNNAICFYPNGADCFNNLSNALYGSFSWTAWVKTTNSMNADFANAYFGSPIWFEYSDGVNQAVFSITGSKAAFTVGNPNGGSDTTLHSATSVNDGTYHFLAATRNEASGVMSLYVDGQLEATAVSTNGPRIATATMYLAGGDAGFYQGLLDDVRVYGGELSAADVAVLSGHPPVNSSGGHSNVAHYTFDLSTSTFDLGLDSSPNGNNMVTYSYWGPVHTNSADAVAGGTAVQFFGTSSMICYDQVLTNLNAVLAGSFTFSTWVKTTAARGNDYDNAYFGATIFWAFNDHSSTNDTIPLAITGSKAAFTTRGGNPGAFDTLHSLTSVNDGSYHLITVTRSQSTGEKKIYVDGNFEASEIGTTNPLNGNNYYLSIGGTTSSSYTGLLDDFQIYSGVLSDSEVAFLYAHPGLTVTNQSGMDADFATALNTTNLTWITGGNVPWFVETTNSHDSVSAARSGAITNATQSSYLETTVTGPGTLSFWWQAAANNFNYEIQFKIDDNYIDNIYGNTSWTLKTYPIGSGPHTLRWVALAYDFIPDTDAGYLDEVAFIPDTAPVITLNPFNQTNHPGYNVALLAAATNSAATWQWFKVGSASPISYATNALFIPTNSGTASVAGSYYGVASNPVGSANTTTAAVSFVSAPLPPDWSRTFTSPLFNNASDPTTNYNIACVLDSTGTNLYTVGSINGTNTFGSNSLISIDGKSGSSILKQTAAGAAVWGRCMTNNGNGSSYAQCVALAPGDGVYVAGDFFGTNWLGTNKLVDTAGGSTYLARFDANGSNLWVRTISGTNFNFTTYHMLAADPTGNVTLSTLISGTTSFGTTNLYVPGQQGVLVQYDANGNIRWLQVPSAWPDYLIYHDGCIYGCMDGNAINYIGGVTNVSDRGHAVFSLNATDGQGNWVRGFANPQGQGNPYNFGNNDALLAVSGTNVFLVGTGWGTNFLFGSFPISFPPDTAGQYFARYDTNGNAQLAISFGSQYTWPWAAVADASGNVYVGGDFDTYSVFGNDLIAAPFYDTVQFVDTIANRIPGQGFVAKFDRNGNPLWARLAQSDSSYLNLRDVALAQNGVWGCGFFNQLASFGPNTINGGLTVVGFPFGVIQYHPGGFLAKITDASAVPVAVTLINPQAVGANFQFSFLSQAGFTHAVQFKTNLAVGNWQTYSNVNGNGTLKTISLPFSLFSPSQQGFIRVWTQ